MSRTFTQDELRGPVADLAAGLDALNGQLGLLIETVRSTGPGNVVDPGELASLHQSLDAAAALALALWGHVLGLSAGSPVPATGDATDLPDGPSAGPTEIPAAAKK